MHMNRIDNVLVERQLLQQSAIHEIIHTNIPGIGITRKQTPFAQHVKHESLM